VSLRRFSLILDLISLKYDSNPLFSPLLLGNAFCARFFKIARSGRAARDQIRGK
jgi:hypothetical protein